MPSPVKNNTAEFCFWRTALIFKQRTNLICSTTYSKIFLQFLISPCMPTIIIRTVTVPNYHYLISSTKHYLHLFVCKRDESQSVSFRACTQALHKCGVRSTWCFLPVYSLLAFKTGCKWFCKWITWLDLHNTISDQLAEVSFGYVSVLCNIRLNHRSR